MKSLQKTPVKSVIALEQQLALCEQIATTTESLSGIVGKLQKRDKRFPCVTTIYGWIRDDPEFADLYSKAKSDQSDILVDQMLEIADSELDEDSNAGVQRARLRVETRKWIASKLKPKLYGDRGDRAMVAIQVQNDLSGIIDLSKYLRS